MKESQAMKHLSLTLSFLLVLAGCGSGGSGSAEKQKVVGVSLLTQTNVFFQDMEKAMTAEAAKKNIKLRVLYAEYDSRKQNDQLDTFIAQKVAAIVVAPTDSSGITPVIAEARRQGIPVFTADIAAKGADVVCHIASDNEKGGELLAQCLVKLLGGKGKIGIIDHPMVTSVQDRTRGFEKVLANYPDMVIVQKVPGEGQRDKAMRATQDLLQAHPEIDAIFGINDDSALGALAAVEAAGLQDKIVIVGFDGTPEARETILAGKALKADAVQYPDKIGKDTIDTVVAYLNGEKVPSLIPVDVGLIDQESLKAEQGK
jgi:ribose transport system substrate-binding protein